MRKFIFGNKFLDRKGLYSVYDLKLAVTSMQSCGHCACMRAAGTFLLCVCVRIHPVGSGLKLNSYSIASVFLLLCRMRISIFWGQERLTDRSISKRYLKAISLHELKKVQLQERYMLVTQDSIGHLKMLCMSVLSLAVALESESTAHRKVINHASVQVWIQF